MSEKLVFLNERYVTLIRSFLEVCIKEKVAPHYVNKLLRDDIMSILENNSIVVYYPLEDEANNGFLTRGFILYGESETRDFVFINTAKDTEMQAFAAAHELGHIWGLVEFFETNGIILDAEMEERVMNRFAAELMIPEEHFRKLFVELILKNHDDLSAQKTKVDPPLFFQIIAELMNEFFVPDKAIILRLLELNFISASTAEFIINELEKPDGTNVRKLIEKAIQDAGYTKLLKPTNKKWINDLPELLERAEKKETLTKSKIDTMRAKFEIVQETYSVNLNDIDLTFLRNGSEEH